MRGALVAIAFTLCISGVEAQGFKNITCGVPTPTGVWSCPASFVNALSVSPVQRWYTLGTSGTYKYAMPWIRVEGHCCKHCVWDLGYP